MCAFFWLTNLLLPTLVNRDFSILRIFCEILRLTSIRNIKLATFHDTFQEVESSYTLQSENGNKVVQCWSNTQRVKM